MFDKITEVNLLYDFYAQLLTEKQREVVRLYHGENWSLSEIGDEFKISRQGVYDALKNAERALSEYEEKLGLVRKFSEMSGIIRSLDGRIDALIGDYSENKELTDILRDLKKTIDGIDV